MGYESRKMTVSIVSIVAAIIAFCTLINWGVVTGNNEHDFDIKCIQSGKSLTFITLEGQDYAKKVCK